jgi:hypothetical protein
MLYLVVAKAYAIQGTDVSLRNFTTSLTVVFGRYVERDDWGCRVGCMDGNESKKQIKRGLNG